MPEPDDPPTFGPLLEVAGDAIALDGMDTLMHSHRSLLWSGPGTTGVSAPARAALRLRSQTFTADCTHTCIVLSRDVS